MLAKLPLSAVPDISCKYKYKNINKRKKERAYAKNLPLYMSRLCGKKEMRNREVANDRNNNKMATTEYIEIYFWMGEL